MKILSIGDVVTLALKIYLFQLKQYFRIALFAHLWLLIPLYGWAKFFAELALISRLVFRQLIDQPEDYAACQKHINSRFWTFLYANVIVTVRMFLIALGVSLFTFVILVIVYAPLPELIINDRVIISSILSVITLLIILSIMLFFVVLLMLFYVRFLLVELLLSVEDSMSSNQAINRSWQLTEKLNIRIFWILNIALLIVLPLLILLEITTEFIYGLAAYFQSQASPVWDAILLIILWVISSLIMPFFQSIKAVLYYDIVNRREGLDLYLRASSFNLRSK